LEDERVPACAIKTPMWEWSLPLVVAEMTSTCGTLCESFWECLYEVFVTTNCCFRSLRVW